MTDSAPVAPRSTLTLAPTLPPWDGLLAAFASVLAYAAKQVGRAEDAPARAVHEYRKSIRRARAAVRLVRPFLKEKRYRLLDGALRQAVLDTSFARDVEVLGDTIDELPRAPDVEAAAAALRGVIEAQQAAACAPAAIRGVLRRGAERLALLPLRFAKALPARLDQDALEDALRASYRRARRRRREALAARSDEAIHGWRKRTKELRYQLELLEPEPQPRERALGRVAKGLGVVTDLIVLRDAVRAHAADLGAAHAEALVSTLDRMIPERFDEVAHAAAPWFEEKARAFARAALVPAPPTVEDAGSAEDDEDTRPRAWLPRRLRATEAIGGPPGLGRPALALPAPPAAALVRAAPVMPRTAPDVPSTRAPRLR